MPACPGALADAGSNSGLFGLGLSPDTVPFLSMTLRKQGCCYEYWGTGKTDFLLWYQRMECLTIWSFLGVVSAPPGNLGSAVAFRIPYR